MNLVSAGVLVGYSVGMAVVEENADEREIQMLSTYSAASTRAKQRRVGVGLALEEGSVARASDAS